MLLIILYIKIYLWYVTLSGNVCQLSSLNSYEDGVYNHSLRLLVLTTVTPDNTTEIKIR